jgi:hypothetical protein
VVEWEGSGGWHPRPCPARRRAGHAKPAVNPIACGSNPVLNPASAGVLNPALAGGHPPGQGSLAVLSKNVVLVRADQDAVFRGVGPRGPGDGNRRGAFWSTWTRTGFDEPEEVLVHVDQEQGPPLGSTPDSEDPFESIPITHLKLDPDMVARLPRSEARRPCAPSEH